MRIPRILSATALTLASAAVLADSAPATGIAGTRHDWSETGGITLLLWQSKNADGTFNPTPTTYVTPDPYIDPATGKQGTVEITIGLCTKCHTPHQAVSTNLLWNHTLLDIQYQWDVPATTAGTVYPKFSGDTYKGASTKCLSCHDGLLSSADGMWFNRRRRVMYCCVVPKPPGWLDSGHEIADGADLSGSHPVAFPYPWNNAPSAYNGTTTGDAAALDEFVADPTLAGIRLFNDDGAGNIIAGKAAGRTGMECTSCHDVHNGSRTKDVMLLTGKLTGSTQADGYICLQCHDK